MMTGGAAAPVHAMNVDDDEAPAEPVPGLTTVDEALGAPRLVVGFTATPEDRELATLGNPLHCFPLSAAIRHGFVLDVLRDFRAPRLPVTVLDAVSKRPVDDARLRRLALETNAVRFPSL